MTRTEMMQVVHRVWNSAPNAVMRKIWAKSDGYGSPGFIPPQGYDWSGIRDSSLDAVRSMYRVAAAYEKAKENALIGRQAQLENY